MKGFNIIACLLLAGSLCAQTNANKAIKKTGWSEQLAQTAMYMWKDSFSLSPGQPARWSYDQGVILKGIEGIWNATGNADYFRYIQKQIDHFVNEDGTIKGYKPDEYNIDHINNGKLILLLYRVTGKEKYKKAADLLRQQLKTHPRTSEGGFWHKKIYPYQMWLDGLYMGQPFYAEYAMLFHEDTAFSDITRQFVMMEKHARDPKTGLLYHGWDESRQQKWANSQTGLSPNFWARALGWYGMAMVDALDHFPQNHPGRDSIVAILNRYAKAIVAVQDPKSGTWYDIIDKPTAPKNYHESSASAMLVYTLAKGVRNGYLPASYMQAAYKGYEGILKEFIEIDSSGRTNLKGTVKVSGLGGNPYRDGSYEYYMSEPVITNDPKGMGAFIKCAVEMEMAPKQSLGKGKNIVLDTYFNNEWKKDATGTMVRWHYTWDDKSNGGFAMLGDIFRIHGAKTTSLSDAPTAANLRNADVYIIVDPDTKKETEDPHFIESQHTHAIADWVKGGGVLVLMGNDINNAEFEHFNQLASTFGIKFNPDNVNAVKDNVYEQGAFTIPAAHSIFKTSKKIFVKELATLSLTKPATSVFTSNNKVIMAVAKYGKGTVFAIGDPWLYNEYVDGRKLPAEYENYKAATDLVNWLLKQNAPKKIVVSQDGKADFRSIQGAINSVPKYNNTLTTIYIKKGVYNEKLYIEKNNIKLIGEDRSNTIITQSIARDEWRCKHNDDWGVATVNVDGNDISFENLTIINDFGFSNVRDMLIECPSDSSGIKVITKGSHQMALRTMNATRLKAVNCHFKAFGGDTVSPWNVDNGMFYFSNCIMEGGVDFYCPRGWAYAENCEFISHTGVAAIWHDGSKHEDSKTVLKNCSFKGFDGFNLGRYHRDAQFYLIGCSFANNMANKPIYRVATTNTILWGERIYYYSCHRQGGDYDWHADNLASAPGSPEPSTIDADWVFQGRWNPLLN